MFMVAHGIEQKHMAGQSLLSHLPRIPIKSENPG
jgi:hypothetical protein